jgi:hypothetical protein
MKYPSTLQQAIRYFTDFENCKRFMIEMRWSDGKVRCPTCKSEKVTYLEKAHLWKCYAKHPCAKFSLKVGTIFEDSPIGLDKWLPAMWLIANCKNGISSYEMARGLGVTQKTAWFMDHRIRLAMQNRSRLAIVKSPKADDLKFQPEAAFDRLRRLAREVLAVPKNQISKAATNRSPKKSASKKVRTDIFVDLIQIASDLTIQN